MSSAFTSFIRPRLLAPAPEPVRVMAEHVRAKHHGVAAVLAYGSAVRGTNPADTLIDLYVLTDSLAGVSSNPFARLGCALVPPNVYYTECTWQGQTYRAKYAMLPLSVLTAKVQRHIGNPYFWARFAQPLHLVWSRGPDDIDSVISILAFAAETAFANAKGTVPAAAPEGQWESLFRETYRTELRPESPDRARQIVDANAEHYLKLAELFAGTPPMHANWLLRRIAGKALTVLRLMKAAFTFQGGADYIAWKIRRHSGVEIKVTDFHRRHPLLAGLLLLPQLLRSGAIR